MAIALQDRPSCTLPSHFNKKKSRLKVLLIGRMSLVTSWCRPTRNRRSRCVGCLHCVKKCCCPSPRGFSRHFLLLSRTTSYAVFRYLFFSKYYFKVFPGVGLYFLLLLSKFLLASKLWFLRTKIIIYWYIYIFFSNIAF